MDHYDNENDYRLVLEDIVGCYADDDGMSHPLLFEEYESDLNQCSHLGWAQNWIEKVADYLESLPEELQPDFLAWDAYAPKRDRARNRWCVEAGLEPDEVF